MSLKALLEQRAKAAGRILQLRDAFNAAGQEFTSEQRTEWEAVNAEHDSLTPKIEVLQRAANVESDQSASYGAISTLAQGTPRGVERIEGQVTERHKELALRAWYRSQMSEDPTDEELEACKRVGLNPNKKEIRTKLIPSNIRRQIVDQCRHVHRSRHPEIISRALSAFTPSAGQLLKYPISLMEKFEQNMLAFGGVETVAETLVTSTGERMQWPTGDDTSNTGSQVGESVAVGTSTDPSFGAVFWDAYKFTSNAVLVPYELLEDSAFDLAAILGGMLGERLGRITNTKATTGTGAGTFKGLVTAAGAGITAASATAIAADELIRLEHSVDPAYRANAGFMMHDSIVLALRLLKNGAGDYLWQSGLDTGAPDRLLGRPVTVNQDMASSIATGAVTVLCGDFSKYKIRRVNDVRFYRLEERYRDNDQDGFVAFLRQDGNLLNAGTNPIKKLTQA